MPMVEWKRPQDISEEP
jgi:calpain